MVNSENHSISPFSSKSITTSNEMDPYLRQTKDDEGDSKYSILSNKTEVEILANEDKSCDRTVEIKVGAVEEVSDRVSNNKDDDIINSETSSEKG